MAPLVRCLEIMSLSITGRPAGLGLAYRIGSGRWSGIGVEGGNPVPARGVESFDRISDTRREMTMIRV